MCLLIVSIDNQERVAVVIILVIIIGANFFLSFSSDYNNNDDNNIRIMMMMMKQKRKSFSFLFRSYFPEKNSDLLKKQYEIKPTYSLYSFVKNSIEINYSTLEVA
jgi:hypothetical protein